jgi:hypothetical protein
MLLLLRLLLLRWDVATVQCSAGHKIEIPKHHQAPAWGLQGPLLQGAFNDRYIMQVV